MKNRIKIPKSNIKIAIIAGIVLFSSIVPEIAYGDFLGIGGALENVGKQILIIFTDAIFFVLSQLLTVAAAFFEGMLTIGLKSALDTIKIGWDIARDFSNMLFILFLIIIAFATILRFEKYGIKQLLPKVIIIALLINFSFVIAGVIIDFSNIAANAFINDIRGKIAGEGTISASFADALRITQTKLVFDDCDDYGRWANAQCRELYGPGSGETDGRKYENCLDEAIKNYEKCEEQGKMMVDVGHENFLNIIFSMIFGSLVLLVATFSLFAGGVMLLFRMMALWLLTIVVPFVFICYIMPGLRRIWQTWWSTFLRWCFFAPAYAFFVWIAIYVAINKAHEKLAYQTGQTTSIFGPTANVFTTDPASQLISYGIIVTFLLGGIIMASKIGIYGAGATMNIVQKAGKGAKAWATRTSMRPVKALGTTVGAGALTAGGFLFGGKYTKAGRRMRARAAQLRQTAAERPEHKKYRAVAERMSNADLLREVEKAKGIRRFIATQEANKRGILREASRTTVRMAEKAMRASGAAEMARKLEELRPDSIEDVTRRKEAIERAIKESTHKKWSSKVFEAPEGTEIAEETRRQLGTGEFTKVFKSWAKDIRDEAGRALMAGFTDKFTGEDLEKRKAFAKATGKTHQAFFANNKGEVQAKFEARGSLSQTEAVKYIQGLKDEDFGNLDSDKDKEFAARHITVAQVAGAGTKLSGEDKELFKQIAREYNKEAFRQMQKIYAWGGSPKESPNIVNLKEEKGKTKEEAWKEIEKETKKIEEE